MIESLFGYTDNKEGKKMMSSKDAAAQYVRILEPKKSQNLAISLKAMSVRSEEVHDALLEGTSISFHVHPKVCKIVVLIAEMSANFRCQQFCYLTITPLCFLSACPI